MADVDLNRANRRHCVIQPLLPEIIHRERHTGGLWGGFFEALISGTYSYGSWFDHACSEHPNDDNFLFVSYESMKMIQCQCADMKRVVISPRFSRQYPSNEKAIDRFVQAVSLDGMRKSYYDEHMKKDEKDSGAINKTICINKGTIGQWRELFTDEQNERFDQLFYEKMQSC